MQKLYLLIALAACLGFQSVAWAQQSPAPLTLMNAPVASAPAPANTTPVTNTAPVAVLPLNPAKTLAPIASQLGQTLQTLVGVPTTQPVSTLPGDATTEDSTGQISDTFATAILNTFIQTFDALKKNGDGLEAGAAAWPDLMGWLQSQEIDPRRLRLWSAIGNDFLVIVGVPLLGGLAIGLLLLPIRLKLRRREPVTISGRVSTLLGILGLSILPVLVFLAASLLLLDQNETHFLPRFVILNVIYAVGLAYTVRQILLALFAPSFGHLRVLSFNTAQAVYACRWFSAYAILIIYGYFFIDVAAALRIPPSVITVFQNILALILTGMTIAVIVQTRARIAVLLRGTAPADTNSFIYAARQRIAHYWHSLAIIYLIIGLGITVLGIENGLALMLRGTILTLGVLVALRLTFVVLDIWTVPSATSPALMHRQILSFLLRPLIWIVATATIGAIWGLHVAAVLATPFGQRVESALIAIALTLVILTGLYEVMNSLIENHLSRSDKDSKTPAASARARTLLPMVRGSVFILFSAITILTFMSAIGINIAPLLAGAGVLGVAVGFGSQTLIKDFLTGLFIIAENAVAVGDVVKIGAFGGVVETISIRAIRLRDTDGSLHILPFSEVTKITNMTKGFAFAVVDIGVAYDSDLERVMQVMREVGATLQEDPVFKRVILEPIEVMGIESLGDSSITLRARIRTRPGKQWDVKRLLLLRIKQRFDKEKIDIPFPTVTHLMVNKNIPEDSA